jgi:hypothetical protein
MRTPRLQLDGHERREFSYASLMRSGSVFFARRRACRSGCPRLQPPCALNGPIPSEDCVSRRSNPRRNYASSLRTDQLPLCDGIEREIRFPSPPRNFPATAPSAKFERDRSAIFACSARGHLRFPRRIALPRSPDPTYTVASSARSSALIPETPSLVLRAITS